MNDQHISPNTQSSDDVNDFSLGGGVDIVQSEDDIDDVEIESYNDDILTEGGMTEKDRIKILRERRDLSRHHPLPADDGRRGGAERRWLLRVQADAGQVGRPDPPGGVARIAQAAAAGRPDR